MQHPDEGTIHAWLDGALQQEEEAALKAHVVSCGECEAAVAEARGLVAASSRIVSALDIVPAGVIPVRGLPKRAWYAAPQFRAAAAIIFVAGASMLIIRGRGPEPLVDTARRAMSEAAQESAPATAQDGAMAETTIAAPPQESPQAQTESRLRAAVKAPEPEDLADEATGITGARRLPLNKPTATDNIVVTGVATGMVAEFDDQLTVVGVDSTGNARVTRYRLASGEEITLNETRPALNAVVSAQAERRAESAREMAAPAAPPPAPSIARTDSAAAAPVAAISWTDPKTSRRYTLRGQVSRERLEQLRKTIESTRR